MLITQTELKDVLHYDPEIGITADDVNSSMIQYLNEHTTTSSSRDEIIAAAYNAVVKHRSIK